MATTRKFLRATLFVALLFGSRFVALAGPIRDGGIDPANLGKGDWVYYLSALTSGLGGNVPAVTNIASFMAYEKSQSIRYIIVKAASGSVLYPSDAAPQFTTSLVNAAHAAGLLIFGYNRSGQGGVDVAGEVAVADYVFNQGADGFVWDAESEWEAAAVPDNLNLAWQICSQTRSNWPTKFLAHAPFDIISYHSSFPYKEFGYWSDAVMPQIYHFARSNIKSRPSGNINWADANWKSWQNSLVGLTSVIDGQTIYWTNAIKPLAPVNHVYGPNPPNAGVSEIPPSHVMEFVDLLGCDPNTVTAGGYKGASFWRADLHGVEQWTNIQNATIGDFLGLVNTIVIDDAQATTVGPWTSTRVFSNGSYYGATGTDTNCFGTNYLSRTRGSGASYVQFTPTVVMAGDYNVYEWHPFRTNASSGTPFVILHAAGSNTVYANQKTNSGNWSWLGQYRFAAGTAGKIRVLDNFADNGSMAIADGIKMVFVPPTNPPVAPANLNASVQSSSQIKLTWTDLATNELVYAIARSLAAGGPFADVGAVTANATAFTNTGLAAGTTYYYQVRATNAAGTSTSLGPVAASTPVDLPVIITLPQSQSVFPGQPVAFSVTATGTPPLAYQWLHGASPIVGATNSNYTIAAAQGANAGTYAVVVSNPAGAVVSSNASLLVHAALAFGHNVFGQSGLPNLALTIAVAAGDWHSLALFDDGHVLAWGNNFNGQCNVPATLSNAMAIAGGGYHSLALRADGTVIAWGANDYGQCSVPAGLKNVMGLAAGRWHSLALKTDGTVAVWGDNTWGQTNLPAGLTEVKAVAAGGNHCLALKSNGTVVAWGHNDDANGIFVGQSVVPPGLGGVVAIGAGAYHSLAVKSDGTVTVWGDNAQGQAAPPGGLNNVVAVVGGGAFSLALRADGNLTGWGANASGQLNFPPTATNIVALAVGNSHTLVLLDDASLPVPRLRGLALGGGRFAGFVPTTCRRKYALEFENFLTDANWISLGTNPGNGAVIRVADPAATAPARFYRVRRW